MVLLATSPGGDDGTVNGVPLTRNLTYAGPQAVGPVWFMAKQFIAGTAAGTCNILMLEC